MKFAANCKEHCKWAKKVIITFVGIWVIVCVQMPSHHILQTFRPLRIFKNVFRCSRCSSLYPKPLFI